MRSVSAARCSRRAILTVAAVVTALATACGSPTAPQARPRAESAQPTANRLTPPSRARPVAGDTVVGGLSNQPTQPWF